MSIEELLSSLLEQENKEKVTNANNKIDFFINKCVLNFCNVRIKKVMFFTENRKMVKNKLCG